MSFLLENVNMSEEKENMDSFSDLLRFFTTEKVQQMIRDGLCTAFAK